MVSFFESGKITAQVLREVRYRVCPVATIADIIEFVEGRFADLGATPAFDTSVAPNNVVAHAGGVHRDENALGHRMIKIDCGASLDGYLTDSAITIDLDGTTLLSRATEEALTEAIKVVRAGASVSSIGRAVQDTLYRYRFLPIANLGGHSIERNVIHAPPFIANTYNIRAEKLVAGQIIAIEPLATNGRGWCFKKPGSEALYEIQGSLVAHFEHTLLVTEDGCEVLTER